MSWLAPLVFIGALLTVAKMLNTNPPTNSAKTSEDEGELRTRHYKTGLDAAAKTIAAITLSTYGRPWKRVETKHISDDEVQLVFHVPVIVFTDILTVTLKHDSDDTTRVDVESHSQIGQGDFGENRRHILKILAAADNNYS